MVDYEPGPVTNTQIIIIIYLSVHARYRNAILKATPIYVQIPVFTGTSEIAV